MIFRMHTLLLNLRAALFELKIMKFQLRGAQKYVHLVLIAFFTSSASSAGIVFNSQFELDRSYLFPVQNKIEYS